MAKSDSMALKIMKHVNKKRKGESILSLGGSEGILLVDDVLSTGFPDLDRILASSVDNRWGLPVGRIINVKAKPSVGKTTFILKLARQTQKRKGIVWIVESEHALDREYIKKLKCDEKEMLISQPEDLEGALESIEIGVEFCAKLREEGDRSPFLIVLDSFSGFTTEGERGGGGGLGEHARLASQFCRKMTGAIAQARVILVVVHQIKSKIGVVWGSPETHIGGDAFNFHGSITLGFRRTNAIKEGTRIVGHLGVIKTAKNKLFPPFQEVNFKLINGKGFDRNFSILRFLINEKVIIKKGGWFYFKEKKVLKFQGADNFEKFLKTNKKARILTKSALGITKRVGKKLSVKKTS